MRFLPLMLMMCTISFAQQKAPSVPAMPSLAELQKMTPEELEAYKQKMLKQTSQQAKDMAAAYNLKINEQLLPDYQLTSPVRDVKKLSLIPVQPPTWIQLADGLRQTKQQLESVAPKAVLEQVAKVVNTQTVPEQQSAAVGAFYADKPAAALLIAMNATLKETATPLALNNLAAMFNMIKLEHKAVPLLMHLLQSDPNNSMFLNNMGQAYLGMGDLTTAENYLIRCLAEDDLNPEANHSMGLIRYFQKRFDEGTRYFEKELQVAYRRSTLALLKKQGKTINLYQLRQKKPGIPKRNFFEEINLSQFKLPDFPTKSDQSRIAQAQAAGLMQSINEEMLFWISVASERNEAEEQAEGKRPPGLYHDLVNEMLEDFHGLFPYEKRHIFEEEDLAHIGMLIEDYSRKMMSIKCPEAPAGSDMGVQLAYQKKCCDIKKPITDAFMQTYNAFVSTRISTVLPRWKHYLNGLVDIVSLDPSLGNKKMVYHNVQQFFSFLMQAWGSGQFPDPPPDCNITLTAEQAEAIIKSSRNANINCPQWLNLEFDFKLVKLKADCSKYAVEVGQVLQGAYEKEFSTGKSTIAAGAGVDAKFWHFGKASAKQLVYITFDNNNQFADFGLKGQAGANVGIEIDALEIGEMGKVNTTLIGVEGGYTAGIHSGFTGSVAGEGFLKEFINLQTKK